MQNLKLRILVLGATGMLGNAVLRYFARQSEYDVFGTVRAAASQRLFPEDIRYRVIAGVDVENIDSLTKIFGDVQPDVVINCIGLVKQLDSVNDPLVSLPINSLLPHRLARLCKAANARFVHMSTDCIFSGNKGMYTESDPSDAKDLYGVSKFIGEVDYPNAITLRTSIIGHELGGARSLVGWFLAQEGSVKGYDRAIFSGLPTVEIARIIHQNVLPFPELRGVYHVSASPINKFDLLTLVAKTYGKEIEIVRDSTLAIDRSLDSSRFMAATGFRPAQWPELILTMKKFG